MPDSQLTVGLVDGHPILRVGVTHALRRDPAVALSWAVATAGEVRSRLASFPVDVLLVEAFRQRAGDVIELIRDVARDCPGLRIIAMGADPAVEAAILHAGAAACLPADAPVAELLSSVRGGRAARRRPAPAAAGQATRAHITRREAEVLRLIETGLTNREIAVKLNISVTTVNKHVHSILAKVGARNRAHAASLWATILDVSA